MNYRPGDFVVVHPNIIKIEKKNVEIFNFQSIFKTIVSKLKCSFQIKFQISGCSKRNGDVICKKEKAHIIEEVNRTFVHFC